MFTEAANLFCFDTVSLFLVLYKVFFIFIKFLKSDAPSALNTRLFRQYTSQISEILMRCANELHYLNYCSYKMNEF